MELEIQGNKDIPENAIYDTLEGARQVGYLLQLLTVSNSHL